MTQTSKTLQVLQDFSAEWAKEIADRLLGAVNRKYDNDRTRLEVLAMTAATIAVTSAEAQFIALSINKEEGHERADLARELHAKRSTA